MSATTTITIAPCAGCCAACVPEAFGESFILDISGLVGCGCLERMETPGTYYSLDFPDGYPSEFELFDAGGGTWASVSQPVDTDIFNGGTDSECEDVESGENTIQARAACQDNPMLPGYGKLRVLVIVGLFTVFEGYFSALGETVPNVNECGQPTNGPLFFMALVFGGTGTITPP